MMAPSPRSNWYCVPHFSQRRKSCKCGGKSRQRRCRCILLEGAQKLGKQPHVTNTARKRRFHRFPYQVPVLAHGRGQGAARYGRLEQLGRGGCGFVTSGPFPGDRTLGVEICLGGGVLRATGKIVYQRRAPDGWWEIGVEFVDFKAIDLPLLDLALFEAVSSGSLA